MKENGDRGGCLMDDCKELAAATIECQNLTGFKRSVLLTGSPMSNTHRERIKSSMRASQLTSLLLCRGMQLGACTREDKLSLIHI